MKTLIDTEPLSGVILSLWREDGEHLWAGSVSRVLSGDVVVLSHWSKITDENARKVASLWDVAFTAGLAAVPEPGLIRYVVRAIERRHRVRHERHIIGDVTLDILPAPLVDWPTLSELGYTHLTREEGLTLREKVPSVPAGSAVLSRRPTRAGVSAA